MKPEILDALDGPVREDVTTASGEGSQPNLITSTANIGQEVSSLPGAAPATAGALPGTTHIAEYCFT